MNSDYLMLRKNKLSCEIHVNSELEILYVESGDVTVNNGTESICVSAGEAILIFPYHLHGFACDPETNATVFMFSFSIAEEFCNTYKTRLFSGQKITVHKTVADLIKYALNSFEKEVELCRVKSVLYALAADFLKKGPKEAEKIERSFSMQEIMEYIFMHLSEKMTLHQLSVEFGINKVTLSLFFKDKIGMSFNDFVNNVRIERAKSLLRKNDITVTEIAYECGFGCVRSFNRAFLKALSITPSEYRKTL